MVTGCYSTSLFENYSELSNSSEECEIYMLPKCQHGQWSTIINDINSKSKWYNYCLTHQLILVDSQHTNNMYCFIDTISYC